MARPSSSPAPRVASAAPRHGSAPRKVPDGWWVYLINNKGVTKFTTTPETLDFAETAKVTVALRELKAAGVRELREGAPVVFDRDKNAFTLEVGPGDIRIVKITL